MFDQIKVNQNSIINLLKTPERENTDNFSKNAGKDFFSMVIEKSGYDEKKTNKYDESVKSEGTSKKTEKNENSEPVKIDQYSEVKDSTRSTDKRDRDESLSDEKKIDNEESKSDIKKDLKKESASEEIIKDSENLVNEVISKRNNEKESGEEFGIINHLQSEVNVKKIIEIIKAVFNGDKKTEEDNIQKFFGSLKLKQNKENPDIFSFSALRKNDSGKNQKTVPEFLDSIKKEFKESLNKEIFKSIENRKSGNKPHILNDKELKELASNIIESVKKNKAKEIVKHEARIVLADDAKIDKKITLTMDPQLSKKTEISDDSSFEKNGAKDKNSGKENFSYHGGKIDFSSKSGLEKFEHNLKMSDFKENLQEIIDKGKVTVRDARNGTFTIRLNPQELGNVNVNLIMENGVITGKFLVDNEDVKGMLLNSLNDLKHQFEEAGISVGEFSVNVNDQGEKYLKQKDDETLKSLSFVNSDRDVIAATDQYNSNAAVHAGHINMVI